MSRNKAVRDRFAGLEISKLIENNPVLRKEKDAAGRVVEDEIEALALEIVTIDKDLPYSKSQVQDLKFFLTCLRENNFGSDAAKGKSRFLSLIAYDENGEKNDQPISDSQADYRQIFENYIWINGCGAVEPFQELAQTYIRDPKEDQLLKMSVQKGLVVNPKFLDQQINDDDPSESPISCFCSNQKKLLGQEQNRGFLHHKAEVLNYAFNLKSPDKRDDLIKEEVERNVIEMQRMVRGFVGRREAKRKLEASKAPTPPTELTKEDSALKLQRLYRGYKARSKILSDAVKGVDDEEGKKAAALKIQKLFKATRNRFDNLKQEEATKNKAATKIQKVYRGSKAREDLEKKDEAATKIQRRFRKYLVRNPKDPLHTPLLDPMDPALVISNASTTNNPGFSPVDYVLDSALDFYSDATTDLTYPEYKKHAQENGVNDNYVPSIIGGGGYIEKGSAGVKRSGIQKTSYGLIVLHYDGPETCNKFSSHVDAARKAFEIKADNNAATSLSGQEQETLFSVARLTNRPQGEDCYAIVTVTPRGVTQTLISDTQFKNEIEIPMRESYKDQFRIQAGNFAVDPKEKVKALFNNRPDFRIICDELASKLDNTPDASGNSYRGYATYLKNSGKHTELYEYLATFVDNAGVFKAGTFETGADHDDLSEKWKTLIRKRESAFQESHLTSFTQSLEISFDSSDKSKSFYADFVAKIKDGGEVKDSLQSFIKNGQYSAAQKVVASLLDEKTGEFKPAIFKDPALASNINLKWKELSEERAVVVEPAVKLNADVAKKAKVNFDNQWAENYEKIVDAIKDPEQKKSATKLFIDGKYTKLHDLVEGFVNSVAKDASIFDPAKITRTFNPEASWNEIKQERKLFVEAAKQKSDYNLEAIAKVLNGKIGELQEIVDSSERANHEIAKVTATKEIFEQIIFSGMQDALPDQLKAKQEALTLFGDGKYKELKESLFDEHGKARNPQLFKDYLPPAPGTAAAISLNPTTEGFYKQLQDEKSLIDNFIARNATTGVLKDNAAERGKIDSLQAVAEKIRNFEVVGATSDFVEIRQAIKDNGLTEKVTQEIATKNSAAVASNIMQSKVKSAAVADKDRIGLTTEEINLLTRNGNSNIERRIAKALSRDLPLSPAGGSGLSFMNHKASNQVTLTFNSNPDNNIAYIYIPGTKECYVRAQMCTISNSKEVDGKRYMRIFENGKEILKRAELGEVAIDSKTIMQYRPVYNANGHQVFNGKTGKPEYEYKEINTDLVTATTVKGKTKNLAGDVFTLGLHRLTYGKSDSRSDLEKETGMSLEKCKELVEKFKSLEITVVSESAAGRSVDVMLDGKSQIGPDKSREVLTKRIDKTVDGGEISFEFDSAGKIKQRPGMEATAVKTFEGCSYTVPGAPIENPVAKTDKERENKIQLFGSVSIVTHLMEEGKEKICAEKGDLLVSEKPFFHDKVKKTYEPLFDENGKLIKSTCELIRKEHGNLTDEQITEIVEKFKKSFSVKVSVSFDEVKEYKVEGGGTPTDPAKIKEEAKVLVKPIKLETVVRPGNELISASSEIKDALIRIGTKTLVSDLIKDPRTSFPAISQMALESQKQNYSPIISSPFTKIKDSGLSDLVAQKDLMQKNEEKEKAAFDRNPKRWRFVPGYRSNAPEPGTSPAKCKAYHKGVRVLPNAPEVSSKSGAARE